MVRRASGLFDALIVGVADSKNKRPFFSLDERLEIANEVLGHYPNVKVESFSGLLKDFVALHPISARTGAIKGAPQFAMVAIRSTGSRVQSTAPAMAALAHSTTVASAKPLR